MKRIILSFLIIGSVWLGYSMVDIYSSLEKDTSNIGRIFLTDRYGNTLADLPKKEGYQIPYTGDLDAEIIESIIEVEDHRFFAHMGVDIIGKVGALRDNLTKGTNRGGSTITEQYIKNRYFREQERTLLQKLREALWASITEVRYTKDEILRGYLDSVYMGNGVYGLETARAVYWPLDSIDSLKDDVIVEIITRLRYPNLSGGAENYRKAIESKLGYTGSEIPFPKREKPEYTDLIPLLTSRIREEIGLYCLQRSSRLRHFLADDIPKDLCEKSDITLHTSIDISTNLRAADTLEAILYPLEAKNVHNGSILAIDPKTEKVLIYVGNRNDATGNAIDMVKVRRSVGSTLKPFLYLMGLERGMDPSDLILDETKVYGTEDPRTSYISENYNPKSYGPITLREALGNSLNSATVRLSEYIGLGRIYGNLKSLGFPLDRDAGYYGYSMMLGGIELSLEGVIDGYKHLTDFRNGEKYLLYDMLADGVNRSMTFGISSILNTSTPLAVKTGTSTDFRDNWTIGYNDSIIIGVWVGNADNSSMDDVSGVTGAGTVYHSIAEDLIARGYILPTDTDTPTGIETAYLCQDEKCLQKEIVYTRAGYERKSRPKSGLYYESDFVTPLTTEEKKKWKIR